MNKQALKLIEKLKSFSTNHILLEGYYEGDRITPTLGIAAPHTIPELMSVVMGWPATAVDVLEERIDFQQWDDGGKYGLDEVYDENFLETEGSLNHLDSLMYGCGFVHVSAGADDEPDVLVTVESPRNTTGVWDPRKRRLTYAIQLTQDEDGEDNALVVYEESRTVYYRRASVNGGWVEESVDDHRLGRVPLVFFPNRARASRREGRSEITRFVRTYTDMGVRTLAGMEINREFFSAPQRYVLGAKEDTFVDEQGNPIPGWKAILGHLWGIERDEKWVEEHGGDGLPEVGQFTPNPPGPYLEQIAGLGKLFSAEAAIPPAYLGLATDQAASSADAIRALEARLVKRAERRQRAWSAPWIEVAQLAVAIKQGGRLPDRGDIVPVWGDPATPTRSADADRAVKITGAGIIPADSTVARDMVGITPAQQKILKREAGRKSLVDLLKETPNVGTPGQPGTETSGNAESLVAGVDIEQ